MGSEARARLALLIETRGMDGALRVNTYKGVDLPPGSSAFPPCQCPQHLAEADIDRLPLLRNSARSR